MRPLHVCALSSLCCLVVGCGSDSSARPDPAPDVVQQDFITEDDIVPPVVGWALWTGLTSQTSPSSNGEAESWDAMAIFESAEDCEAARDEQVTSLHENLRNWLKRHAEVGEMPASTEQNTMLESLRRLREEFLSSRESLGFTEPVVDPKFWKPDLEPVVDPKVWKPDLEGQSGMLFTPNGVVYARYNHALVDGRCKRPFCGPDALVSGEYVCVAYPSGLEAGQAPPF